jgi:hypothetical protein
MVLETWRENAKNSIYQWKYILKESRENTYNTAEMSE